MPYRLSHLAALEAEAISIVRETVAQCERPALLFSGGKDSAVLLHVAVKAIWPQRLFFPLVHVDTGHNFPEAIAFRDRRVAECGAELVVGSVPDAIAAGRVADPGPGVSRNRAQTPVLVDLIAERGFDALFGGARRDEEKARAKERVFSLRDSFGQWDPRRQRPEVWNLYNARHNPGEHVRVFPLSNWTELDVWHYVAAERLELPSIYLAHEREVFRRAGLLMAASDIVTPDPAVGEEVFTASVRFRTVGDMTCTAAVASQAATVEEVIAEIARSRVSERGETRVDDRFSESAMELRKREGYF